MIKNIKTKKGVRRNDQKGWQDGLERCGVLFEHVQG